MSAERFLQQFKAARRSGCSLLAVASPDATASIQRLLAASASIKAVEDAPAFAWDAITGLAPLNPEGTASFAALLGNTAREATTRATTMLAEVAPRLPDSGLLFLHNVHRYLQATAPEAIAFIQAVWNLRDPYKADNRMLVLLGPQITLPAELQQDCLVLDEPLPDAAELEAITARVLSDNNVPALDEQNMRDAVGALRGLAAFPAEQAVAMATNSRGLALSEVWRRKEQFISQTPGLSVYQGGMTFDDVQGYAQAKLGIRLHAEGTEPFEAVLWFDEAEKMFAGASEDGGARDGGVSEGMMAPLLTKMQEWIEAGAVGMMGVGAPGVGKSLWAKAAGATFGKPTIAVDVGAAKNSLVGESERQMRNILKVVDATTGGRVLVLMTCNKQINMKPELKRRLTGGIYYFELPDDAEQEALWGYFLAKFKLDPKAKRPSYEGWTGAEIRTACSLASTTRLPLEQTGQFIVPVSKSAAEQIAALREQANGRFLSANYPGVYLRDLTKAIANVGKRRLASEN